ncbi:MULTISPECIES: hypothetical protein [Peribacillus]|uniref:hypothetical protein n=1 Tax=Peribacillus TaxID=2675229 RepID=UPI001F4EC9EA|nr:MULTISPECIES: hypothetical protein [unclassified Peribacillus]MCK1983123.1 hypothetical protein [Peribacillus sp. Aquil_B1]MCK2009225.1 hypothetical protein [Peribacillus sp. Aquil_B8]
MFGSLNRTKLIKNDLKSMAKLMYQDVSKDTWDQENLTKRNLDFTIESIRYIDAYTKRLCTTQMGSDLLKNHFDNFVIRIGAYIGETIKRYINQDFKWYEYDSVYHFSSALDGVHRGIKTDTVLYSKKGDKVIVPLTVVAQYLEGKSTYTDFLEYVEETIKQNS